MVFGAISSSSTAERIFGRSMIYIAGATGQVHMRTRIFTGLSVTGLQGLA